jgi:hypothetical protein
MLSKKQALFTAVFASVWTTRVLFSLPPSLSAGFAAWGTWSYDTVDGLAWIAAIFVLAQGTLRRIHDRGLKWLVVIWLISSAAIHSMPDGMGFLGLAVFWALCLQDIQPDRHAVALGAGVVLVGLGSPVLSFVAGPVVVMGVIKTLTLRRNRGFSFAMLLLALAMVAVIGRLRWGRWFGLTPGIWMSLEYRGGWGDLVRGLAWDASFVLGLLGVFYVQRQGLSLTNRWLLAVTCLLGVLAPLFLTDEVQPYQALVSLVPILLLPCIAFLDHQHQHRSIWMGVLWGSILVQLHADGFKTLSVSPRTPAWMSGAWPSWSLWLVPVFLICVMLWLSYDALSRSGGGPRARLLYAMAMLGTSTCAVVAHRWAIS